MSDEEENEHSSGQLTRSASEEQRDYLHREAHMKYVLTWMSFVGYFVLSAQQTNMSLAILDMANWIEVLKNVKGCAFDGEVDEKTEHTHFKWSTLTQGYILASYFYGFSFAQALVLGFASPCAGKANFVSPKYVLFITTIVSTLVNCLIPTFAKDEAYAVIALHFINGLAQGAMGPAFRALTKQWIRESDRTHYYLVTGCGGPIGRFFTLLFSGIVCRYPGLGWSYTFYLFGLLAFLYCILLLILIYDSPFSHALLPKEERIKKGRKELSQSTAIPCKKIFTSKAVWGYFAAGFAEQWCQNFKLTVLPMFLYTTLKYNLETTGFVSAVSSLAEVYMFSFVGFSSEKILSREIYSKTTVRKIAVGIGLLGFSVCLLGVTFTECHRILTLGLIVMGLGLTGSTNAANIAVPREMTPGYSETIIPLMMTVSSLTGAIIPTAVGFLTLSQPIISSWNPILWATCGLCVLCAILFMVLGSSVPQEWAGNEARRMHESSVNRAADGGVFPTVAPNQDQEERPWRDDSIEDLNQPKRPVITVDI